MKLKKLLACVLSFAMILTTMTFTAFADESGKTAPTYKVTKLTDAEIEAIITKSNSSNSYSGTDKLYHKVFKEWVNNKTTEVYGIKFEPQTKGDWGNYRDVVISSDKEASYLVIADLFFLGPCGLAINLNESNNYTQRIGEVNSQVGSFFNDGSFGALCTECIIVPVTEELCQLAYTVAAPTDKSYDEYKSALLTDNSMSCVTDKDVSMSFDVYAYEDKNHVGNKVLATNGSKNFIKAATLESKPGEVFTLEDAFANASENDTITLTRDVTITDQITVTNTNVLKGGVTFDGGNHKIFAGKFDKNSQSVLYFGDTTTPVYCKGITIKDLTIEVETARFGIMLYGGETSTLTNVKVKGDYFYGVNCNGSCGGTFENCEIDNLFVNGQANYPVYLNNNTVVKNLYTNVNQGGYNGKKVYIDVTSSVETLYAYKTTETIADESMDKIGTVSGWNGERDNTCEYFNMAAEVNGIQYANFADALKVATATDTIKLLSNVTFWQNSTARLTNAKEIDLNDKILTLSGEDNNFGNTTFRKGTLDLTATTINGQSLIWCGDENSTTKFEGVTINVPNLNQDGITVISSNYGGTIEFTKCVINVEPTGDRTDFSGIIAMYADGGSVVFEDCDINVSNTQSKLIYCADTTVDVIIKGNTTIDANIYGNGIWTPYSNNSLKILTTEDGNGNVKAPVINITANKRSEDDSDRYGITLGENTVYEVADGAVVNATIKKPISENSITTGLTAKLKATAKAGEYDIVVVPTDSSKVINRLTSAELDFVLGTSDDMSYEITGAENVNVIRSKDHVTFYLDGVNEKDKSGVEVKLGTVKINGYGSYTFGINTEDGTKNIVNTTTLTDNIVATSDESLTIGDKVEGRLEVPTNKLTVEIDFPQAVKDNASGYQQMNVKVVGGTTNTEKDLGGNMTADGKYVVTFDLPENTSYMVEVTGEGYRTARYNVNMNADKTLHFWNNVKDNATEVEESNTESKETVTFLAGEIVKDGKINIYDLSAVVSYFGMKDLNTRGEEYYKYAAYDLNRDGVIDSKDISIVLDAFGN